MNAIAIWKTLDLERTHDVGAIRRAYARRLKQTDVEADPAAFIALREALERALDYASDRPASLEADPPLAKREEARPPASDLTAPDLEIESGSDVVAVRVPAPDGFELRLTIEGEAVDGGGEIDATPIGTPVLAAPVLPAADLPAAVVIAFGGGAPADEHQLRDLRFQRLRELLTAEVPPSPMEIRQAAAAILADPEMTNLKYAAEVEAWMAEAICAASPRSDPVIAEAVPHFGWEADYGKLGQPTQVAAIVEHYQVIRFLTHIAQPTHEFYPAWCELSRTDESGFIWNRWLIQAKVKRLLEVVREKYPAAEAGFQPYRIGLWDRILRRDGYPGDVYEGLGWAVLFLVLFPPAAALIAFLNHNPTWFRVAVAVWAVLWVVWATLA